MSLESFLLELSDVLKLPVYAFPTSKGISIMVDESLKLESLHEHGDLPKGFQERPGLLGQVNREIEVRKLITTMIKIKLPEVKNDDYFTILTCNEENECRMCGKRTFDIFATYGTRGICPECLEKKFRKTKLPNLLPPLFPVEPLTKSIKRFGKFKD